MLLLPKNTKEKLVVLKYYRDRGVEIDVCDRNKLHQVSDQSLHPTCCLLRGWGEETFRRLAWTEMGKDSVTHTDKAAETQAKRWQGQQ